MAITGVQAWLRETPLGGVSPADPMAKSGDFSLDRPAPASPLNGELRFRPRPAQNSQEGAGFAGFAGRDQPGS